MSILAVGSIAYDDVETPYGKRSGQLGGSAVYFSTAASYFAPVSLVGVVGSDFSDSDRRMMSEKGIDLGGMETVEGETFRWSGHYMNDINAAETLDTRLNVFENFLPKLSDTHKTPDALFLANIAPSLQLSVMERVSRPTLLACDTMDLWINRSREDLEQVISRCDVVFMNESEARQFTGKTHMPDTAKALLKMGVKIAVIKRGEYGAAMFSQSSAFAIPAYPSNEVVDPTGAGDSFAGGFVGWLASEESMEEDALRRAMVFGSTMASFTVENFGLARLVNLDASLIRRRFDQFVSLTNFSPPYAHHGKG